MNFEQFKEACFRAAREQGCDEAEIYMIADERFVANVINGEIGEYSVENEGGLNLRVMFGGRMGNAYTERFDNAEEFVAHAVDNARASENDDIQPMQGGCVYPELIVQPNPLTEMTAEEKVNIVLNLERDTLEFDDRVNRTAACQLKSGAVETHIRNTRGLCADSRREYSFITLAPVLRQGDEERIGFSFKFGPDVTNYNDVIKESVDNALMGFNARSVESGEYRVLLRSDAAAELLAAFSGMFFADRVQQGLSLLAGKMNNKIASDTITIVDDPFEKVYPRAFDDEGVPSVHTTVIENGILKSFLYNLKSALKDKVPSTSNAGRADATSPIGTAPSNFYILNGEKSFKELIAELNSGLIITEINGLNSGLNPVSGDFSLIAKGLLVESGSVIRSVDQITCASNFLEILKGILAVGNDLRFLIPKAILGCRFGSPSLLIDKLVVSGK